MNLDFELYHPSYNDELVSLFKKTFKKKIDEEFFLWRFINNPINLNLAVIAKIDNDIVGFASLTPLEGFVNSKKVLFATSGSSMVSPDYQKRGIYTKMANYLYEYAYNSNVDYILGFPNNNSHYNRITKLHNTNIYEIPQFMLKKEHFVDFSDQIEFKFDSTLNNNFKLAIDSFNNKRVEENSIMINSDFRFFNWRYIMHPINQYQVISIKLNNEIIMVIVCKLYKENNTQQIDILDFYFDGNKSDFLTAMSFFLKEYFCKNTKQFNLWLSPHCIYYSFLELIGFKHGEPITYFTCHKNKNSHLIENYNKWYISMANSDIY